MAAAERLSLVPAYRPPMPAAPAVRDAPVRDAEELLPPDAELFAVLEQHAAAGDKAGRPVAEVIAALRSSGALGATAPREHGGAGLDAVAGNRIVEWIARRDGSAGIIVFQHFAVTARVAEWGTPAQKRDILPRLATGEWLAASAWSEPGAGAAKKNLGTRGEEQPDRSWVVSGAKTFTTGAGLADLYLVLAQSDDVQPDDTSTYGGAGQTFFLVEALNPGLLTDTSMDLDGMRASATGFVKLVDCVLPPEAVLGPRGKAPEIIAGVRESGASLGAVSVGLAQAAYDLAFEFARARGLSGQQVVRHRLVEAGGQVEVARAIVERAGRRDSADPGMTTLQSKLIASEAAEKVCSSVQRLLGSAGFIRGHAVNRITRDARAVALMGPTNDLARDLVSAQW